MDNTYGKLLVQGFSEVGERVNNQDAFLVDGRMYQSDKRIEINKELHFTTAPMVFAVADGVGGAYRGDMASRTALEAIHEWFDKQYGPWRESNPNDEMNAFLLEGMSYANEAVLKYSASVLKDSATTLTVLVLLEDRYWLANIGDSSAYIKHHGTVATLSKRHASNEHQLTAYVGNPYKTGAEMTHVVSGVCETGRETFLLCTDGLDGEVPVEALDDMLQAEENVLARTANTKPARDNRTGLLVSLHRANTTFIQREFGHIDSKTEFVNDIVVNAQRYFETWEYQISTNLITDRKGTIHGLVDDWGITLKTARSWLKAEPDRDKVLKLCRTLDADLNRTNRVLSHYASYSVLDEKDPVDSVWIRLIGMRRDELETSGGPQEVLTKLMDHMGETKGPDDARWQQVKRKILDRWEKKKDGNTIAKLWRESEHGEKAYKIFQGEIRGGQRLPRYFLMALGMKEGCSLSTMNEDQKRNGMEDLGRKSIFESVFVHSMQDIELTMPLLIDENELLIDTGGTSTGYEDMSNIAETLEEELLFRLEMAAEEIRDEKLKRDYIDGLQALKRYL